MTKTLRSIFVLFIVCFNACSDSESTQTKSELLGVWLAPAPLSEDIFYRPNSIAQITPDRMTIYEDIFNPTDFTWQVKEDFIFYKNEAQEYKLDIVEKQENRMKIRLENGDSLNFFRLPAMEKSSFTDTDLLEHLYAQTFEIVMSDGDWRFRQLVFLPGGKLIKYQTKSDDMPNFYVGSWQLFVIENHYFLFLHNLKDEKPLLIYLESLSEFNIKGKMAYANDLLPVEIKTVGTEVDLAAIQQIIIGNWHKPNYQFNIDSTFLEIAANDTLSGNWSLNTTGEIILLKKGRDKTLQFGFFDTTNQTINIHYLEEFHNEFTSEIIRRK